MGVYVFMRHKSFPEVKEYTPLKKKLFFSSYLPKTLRINPKMPSTRLKLTSNFSSTNIEISNISLLIVNDVITVNITVSIPETKLVITT